jgi:TPP-dependent pyruvate/acetoin dehydrogenase alpha subunit
MSELAELFQQMQRIRLVEEEIAKRYSEQKMRCPTHLSIGQEAVAVGVSSALNIEDKAYSSHRAHAHYLAKGGSLNKLIAELYGKETGCTGGRGGSMHLCDLDVGFMASTAIVANSIPLAVGHGLQLKVTNTAAISVAYFGDGATEEGAFYEALNFAVLKSLPVLFVCENNLYSVYSPLNVRQPEARSICSLANEIGALAYELDGNDVQQVSKASVKAKQHLLAGNGPILLECYTYRHREHCGPNFDNDLGYRPLEQVSEWLQKDPISLTKAKLGREIEHRNEIIHKNIMQEIDDAFNFAEHSSFPDPANNCRFVYAE